MPRSSDSPKARQPAAQPSLHPGCCQCCGHLLQPPDHEASLQAVVCGTQHLRARAISVLGFQLEEVLEGKERSRRHCGGDGAAIGAGAGVGILI